jgi:hypothetical protein
MYIRAACIIGLFFVGIAAPFLSLGLAGIGMFLFSHFYEAVILGIFLDSLYATPEPRWFGFQFFYTLVALGALCVITMLKKYIRFYTT